MLHYKSKPEDINHYLQQMNMLLLSDKEMNKINQILALENLIKDESLKELIKEDLKDEAWISDTQVLIQTCYKKIEKSLMVQNHIDECKNFLVFRFLEDKCRISTIEAHRQIVGWNFNEVDRSGEKSRWVSQKFLRAFEASLMEKRFMDYMQDNTTLSLTLEWLYTNRELFYHNELFQLNKNNAYEANIM